MKLLACLVAAVLLLEARATACAGCSNPNLPQSQLTGRRPGSGAWTAGAIATATALRVVHESHCPEIGPVCATRDEPPQLHDQAIRIGEVRLFSEYGLTGDWSLQAQLPVKLVDTTIEYRRLDGTPYLPDDEGIHHRNETLGGVMDPLLSIARTRPVGIGLLGLRLGATLPFGRTVRNPFAAGLRGESHQHFQFGTGTIVPVVGLELVRPLGRWTAQGYALGFLSLYDNRHGFRAGHRLSTGAAASYALRPRMIGSFSLDVLHEEAERWDGVVQQDGNLGRTDVLAGLGWQMPALDGVVSLAVRTPIHQRVIGGQVSYPMIVTFAWLASG